MDAKHTAIIPDTATVTSETGSCTIVSLTDENPQNEKTVTVMLFTRMVPALITDLANTLDADARRDLIFELIRGL